MQIAQNIQRPQLSKPLTDLHGFYYRNRLLAVSFFDVKFTHVFEHRRARIGRSPTLRATSPIARSSGKQC
jgi:hypothetical protein